MTLVAANVTLDAPAGLGVAAYASGRKRASGMSYFNSGGNAGYALGSGVMTFHAPPMQTAPLSVRRAIPRLTSRTVWSDGASESRSCR